MDGGGQKKNLEGREAVAKKKWEVGEVVTCQKRRKRINTSGKVYSRSGPSQVP